MPQPRPPQRQQPKGAKGARKKAFDTPGLVATVIVIVLGWLGAFTGFDTYGTLGSFPNLILAMIVIFVIGAALTVRRIMAARTDRPHKK